MAEDGEAIPPTAAPCAGAWTVVAGPFTRPDRLRRFIAAIAGIEGVTHVVARRFRLGELSLSLCYSGAAPLASRLAGLAEFRPRVVDASSVAIWLDLGEGEPDG
jgi:hypothetical protein